MGWPKGHIAIKSFAADVLQDSPDGKAPTPEPCCGGEHWASRKDVFMHHWTVNKWQLPASLFQALVKSGGRDYNLESSWTDAIQTWLADAGNNAGANGPCRNAELHLYFGIGNEVRGKPLHLNHSYEFPDPYGLEFDGVKMSKLGQFMMLNLHLIDIRNVTDVRRCAECDCSYLNVSPFSGTHPTYIGGLACCHSTSDDAGSCPLIKGAPAPKNQTYYMRYTVQWRDFDPETTKPLEVITFDATDNNTQWSDLSWLPWSSQQKHTSFHADAIAASTISSGKSGEFLGINACHVEYYVPPCAMSDTCIHKMPNSWTLPYPVEIVFVRSHFHSGGVNMTLRAQSQHICTSIGTYDSEHPFLIDASGCKAGTSVLPAPVRIERGGQIFAEAVYKQDSKPHFGVMAMSFVYAHVPTTGKGDRVLV